MYPHQAERLTDVLRDAHLDALVATSPANVHYVTGFRSLTEAIHQASPLAVFSGQGTALVVPTIDVPTVLSEGVVVDHLVCFGELPTPFADPATPSGQRVKEIVEGRAVSPADALAAAMSQLGLGRESIGLDECGLSHDTWRAVTDLLGSARVAAAADRFAEARRVKAPYEIECVGQALHIAEEALDAVIQAMDRGMTEREAAALYR